MPDQFEGLVDRTRVFPVTNMELAAGDVGIDRLHVNEIHIGGILIRAVGGTRYANGRLSIEGKGDNSAELQLQPGPDCTSMGVIAQILMFHVRTAAGWLRHCWSFNRDSGGGDLFNEDQGVSGTRVQAPWYRKAGERTYEVQTQAHGRTYQPGEDDGGRYVEAIFADGSDEVYLPDGRRVTRRSLALALVELCDRQGIALEIR